MAYSLRTNVTWAQTYSELEEQFALWGVRDFEVRSLGKASRADYQDGETRRVTVRWTSRGGQEHTLTMADQDRAVDNLRVLFLAIKAVRLNEVRGIGQLAQDYYLRLAAPVSQRSPYEVLNLTPHAPLEVAEASYKALAKLKHPDTPGGSEAAMKELNEAIEQLRGGQVALT